MSTRTSDRYPETLAKRSASSNAASVALVCSRWATVRRRGCTTSTRGRLSTSIDFAGAGDAARCRQMPLGGDVPGAEADHHHHQDLYAYSAGEIHDVLTLISALVPRSFSRVVTALRASVTGN